MLSMIKRTLHLFCFLFLCGCLSNVFSQNIPVKNQRLGINYSVKIDSDAEWQNTGIYAEKNSSILLSAFGKWSMTDSRFSFGWQGSIQNPSKWGDYRVLDSYAHGQLICRILSGQNILYFTAGRTSFAESGFIQCRINDKDVANNTGSLILNFYFPEETVSMIPDGCSQDKFLKSIETFVLSNVKEQMKNSCNLNFEDKNGNTAAKFLIRNYRQKESKKILQFLLFYGLNVNYKSSYNGSFPLLDAAKYGDIEVFKILADFSPDVKGKDFNENTVKSVLDKRQDFGISSLYAKYENSLLGQGLFSQMNNAFDGIYIDEQNISVVKSERKDDTFIFFKKEGLGIESEKEMYRLKMFGSANGVALSSGEFGKDELFYASFAKNMDGRMILRLSSHFDENSVNMLFKSDSLTRKFSEGEKLKIKDISEDKRLCLAFSIGGLEGLVHLGALYAFDFLKLKPKCIFGTSMGSIVGGIYAKERNAKKSLNTVKKFIREYKKATYESAVNRAAVYGAVGFLICPWCSLAAGSLGAKTVTKMDIDRFTNVLDESLEGVLIENLPIPYETMTLEFKSKDKRPLPRYFKSGKLSEAIRGSVANPLIFENLSVNYQIDPGIDSLRVVPIHDTFKEFKPDFVIALNASGEEPEIMYGYEDKVLLVNLLNKNESFSSDRIFNDDKYLNEIAAKGFVRALENLIF